LSIGTEDEDDCGHDYSLTVCTPKWLVSNGMREGPVWGRHFLFIERYDYQEIIRSIKKMISENTRESPEKSLEIFGRFMLWEYEDYNDRPPLSGPC
jgi:hypothetical protein